jgi:sugar phosphate isomerase/epimerase
MRHVLSTQLFAQHCLTPALLERIRDGGITAVELFCERPHLDFRDKAQVRDLGLWFRDAEVKVHALHSDAAITITERNKSKRIPMVDALKRTLEIAETIPFTYLIQHLGETGELFSEFKMEAAFTALEMLIPFARHRGVEILLENTLNDLSSPQRLAQFNDFTQLNLNFCFDTGHANLHEGVAAAFALMKPRVRSTHVHDNDGKQDQHLFPLTDGTIDWPHAMALLRLLPVVLEVREVPDMAQPFDAIRSTFEQLEALEVPHE